MTSETVVSEIAADAPQSEGVLQRARRWIAGTRGNDDTPRSSVERSNRRDLRRIQGFLAWAIGIGVGVELLLGKVLGSLGKQDDPLAGWRVSVSLLLLSAAASATGAFFGFIFGIPKASTAGEGRDRATDHLAFTQNTNLEQISDWLTKILVGLTLAKLGEIGKRLSSLGETIAPALHPMSAEAASALALASLIYFCVCGFLGGYALTFLVLTPALERSERLRRDSVALLGNAPLMLPADASERATINVSYELQDEARKLAAIPLSEVQGVQEVRGWAKAQASQGNFGEAARALERAARQDPANARIKYEYGVVLSELGERRDAIVAMESALSQAETRGDVEGVRRAVEGLMLNYLYLSSPSVRGYDRVIALSERFSTHTLLQSSGVYFMYLACAFGQKYAWRRDEGASEDELTQLRSDALHAARRAIQLDPSLRRLIRRFWDGSDPLDNDLTSFAKDPEFSELLEAQG